MKRKQLNIEELLEEIGTHQVPGDPEHRYDLRRALLCSRYFEGGCSRQSRWEILFSYTAPLVAGGVVVGVFAFMAMSVSSPEVLNVVDATTGEVEVATIEVSEEATAALADSTVPVSEFVSDTSDPLIQLADFENMLPYEDIVRFIPVYPDAPSAVR